MFFKSWFFSGSERMRLPVAAKIALHSAGATTATGGSPTPLQKPPPGTMTIGRLDDANAAIHTLISDRLAVLPSARVHRLGGTLVRFAVRTAGELGGARMVAQVQVANVPFFEWLGWVRDGEPGLYRGVMHQPMATAL